MPPLSSLTLLKFSRDDHSHSTDGSKGDISFLNSDLSRDVQYVCNERKGGGSYTGEVSSSSRLPHGYGWLKWANGGEYEGRFSEGYPNGRGKLLRHDGSTYYGDFKTGNMHGLGSLEFKNGDIGVFNWTHGRIYTKAERKRSKSRKMWSSQSPDHNLVLV